MMRNEARDLGPPEARIFLGWAIRNRFNPDDLRSYFQGQNSYYESIVVKRQATYDTRVTTGEKPELDFASAAFNGYIDPTSACQGFWTPTPSQWANIKDALTSGTSTLPANVGAPFNYNVVNEITQFVVFDSVRLATTTYPGTDTPAFVFVRKRDPAVVGPVPSAVVRLP
jgi:hypothetical protein